ncbi:MAG: hypothetical protein KatS3mg115_0460 [Candidatus Poribacteria bacterium]|nr:MAG: hypothetical protein KatS3mg115_0460 [Candidatus Poribacteria bacterium]
MRGKTVWRLEPARLFLLVLMGWFGLLVSAWAIRVQVVMPNGDRYTGEWIGSDGAQYRIRLDGGQELQLPLPVGGWVIFLDPTEAAAPPEARQRLQAALDAWELGMHAVADRQFQEAIALAPRYARAHYEYARFLEAQQASEAFQHYVYAAQLDPVRYPIGDKIRAEASQAAANGNYLRAAEALFAFARTFPQDPYATEAAYEAAGYFQKELETDPTNATLLSKALLAYEYATEAFPEAPQSEEGLLRLGQLYVQAQRPEDAVRVLRNFVEWYPDSPLSAEAHLALGRAYLQLGAMESVAVEARIVLSLTSDPDLQEQAFALAAEVAWRTWTTAEGLPANEVFALHKDGTALWVGTINGLARLEVGDPNNPALRTTPLAAGQIVRALASDPRYLWVGTSGAGLIRYDKQTGQSLTYTHLDGLPSVRIDALALDETEVWAGGLKGLARFRREAQLWEPIGPEVGYTGEDVSCLLLTPEALYVGTRRNGLYRYDRQTGAWEAFTRSSTEGRLGSNAIRSLTRSDSALFVGWYTQDAKGYSVLDLPSRQWFNAPVGHDEISPEHILLHYQNGRLWVALNENLLVRQPDGIWAQIHYPMALDGADVEAVLADGDFVWVGTSAGLGRVNTAVLQTVEEQAGGQ